MVTPLRRRTSAGFALLDAIVASVILGSALATIIGLGQQALSSQRTGEEIAVASMLADEQLNLVLARGPDTYAKSYPVEGACDAPFAAYRFQVSFSGGTGGSPYRVSCTIFWGEGANARSIKIETLIAARTGADPNPDRQPEAAVERPQ